MQRSSWKRRSRPKKTFFGTRAPSRFVVPPKFKACASFGLLVRGGSRGRFRPRSAAVLPPGRTGRFQRCAPLWGSAAGLLLRLLRGVGDCILFSKKCQDLRPAGASFQAAEAAVPRDEKPAVSTAPCAQAMGRVEGLTIYRQSRSPRARPRTSISAVAILLAKGMLFWSHRREI